VFDIHCFETIEEARVVIGRFIDDYNRHWLLERLDYRSPLEFRADHQNVLL